MKLQLFYVLSIVLLSACGPTLPEEVAEAMRDLPEKIDYNIHVKPILSDRCFACHGNDKNKLAAGLRLDNAHDAYAELPDSPGAVAIAPGDLTKSEVIRRLFSDDPDQVMPPPESNLVLTPSEKAILTQWIDEGAEYKPHWAFTAPQPPPIPKVQQEDWAVHPIDRFVLKTLESKGWQPSPEADRESLLRRVTFDLTGLPPTIEEIDRFTNDPSPEAYEKVVGRLLQSPHYAERMATDWLDLARFADTHGYTVDRYRDMSPWRDWVIGAFDQNMPYDTFTIWQLAGDLLPNASQEQILATGFNRNHQQNMEGGIVDEEFRVEYVADRTNTLGAAFLGLTVECARCHDHKYDPISHKEYFELFSFFNNVQEAGQISWNNAMPGPTLLLADEKVEAIIDFLDDQIAEQQAAIEQIQTKETPAFQRWLEGSKRKALNSANAGLLAHFNFENRRIVNRLQAAQKGVLKQMFTQSKNLKTEFVEGQEGNGLRLDGDAWVDLGSVGIFDMASPFSVGLWVKLPKDLENGVLFHKGHGAALYNFRGYHLALKNNQLEILMAHAAPYNAIIQYADDLPREEWIHLLMTYDGSAKAAGLHTYLNGRRLQTKVTSDHLSKDILFQFEQEPEPGLQIGARWRGAGIKGAVVDDIKVFNRTLSAPEALRLAAPTSFKQHLQQPSEAFTAEEKEELKAFYFSEHQEITAAQQKLRMLRKEQNTTRDNIQEVMVMQEMPEARPTYLLERGQYDAPGERVHPATIAAVLPLPASYPKNRLGLARWLFHPDHPMTARVAVNRYWQQFFGRGLVKSADDFGNQGEMPSHPELLDWLAMSFRDSGWDVKALLKQIVLSATYRQSSKIRDELAAQDVENVYLWRGPTVRLTAEMMRDNALAASQLLVRKIGGKSVKPYQPKGLWAINGNTYQADSGENLYRRSLYSFWKRSMPLPTQGTFDAPNRSVCTVKRQKTSTPLQALVLLNDPTFLEAAKVLGEQMSRKENNRLAIVDTFRKLSGRKPLEGELDVLLELQQKEYEKFVRHPEKMSGWLKAGAYELDAKLPPEKVAANAVVASTILNADATIIKR
ncbi:MAG: DUF1553 domain-containing protein [Bacteroidota bacterium]